MESRCSSVSRFRHVFLHGHNKEVVAVYDGGRLFVVQSLHGARAAEMIPCKDLHDYESVFRSTDVERLRFMLVR